MKTNRSNRMMKVLAATVIAMCWAALCVPGVALAEGAQMKMENAGARVLHAQQQVSELQQLNASALITVAVTPAEPPAATEPAPETGNEDQHDATQAPPAAGTPNAGTNQQTNTQQPPVRTLETSPTPHQSQTTTATPHVPSRHRLPYTGGSYEPWVYGGIAIVVLGCCVLAAGPVVKAVKNRTVR